MQDDEPTTTETPGEGAARRLVRLTSDRADALDKAELERWRAADPRHEQAWRATVALWRDTAALQRDGLGRARPPKRQLGRRAVIAAGGAGLVGAVGLAWDRGGPALLLADMATGTAETSRRLLPDGSALSLDARSSADLEFDGDTRQIRLDAGALFLDAQADARPFLVEVGEATIVLDGPTRLAAGRRNGGFQVAVASGHARIQAWPGATAATLRPGRMLEVASGRLLGPHIVAVAGIGAWRQGRLVAEDRPLPEVVEELGVHFRGLILLRGAASGQTRVSVALDLLDVPAALASLAGVLNLELRWPMPRLAVLGA